jgi:hypothetical protein
MEYYFNRVAQEISIQAGDLITKCIKKRMNGVGRKAIMEKNLKMS